MSFRTRSPIRGPRIFAAVTVLAGLCLCLAACADLEGIEDVSGTLADEDAEVCIEVVNALRQSKHLSPVERWLDYEPCAVQTGQALLGDDSKLSCSEPSKLLCEPSNAPLRDALEGCVRTMYAGEVVGPVYTELACGCGRKDDVVKCVMYLR